MDSHRKKITEEQYKRGIENRGSLCSDDFKVVFTEAERWGYGVYSPMVHKDEETGEFYVSYWLGSTCD